MVTNGDLYHAIMYGMVQITPFYPSIMMLATKYTRDKIYIAVFDKIITCSMRLGEEVATDRPHPN